MVEQLLLGQKNLGEAKREQSELLQFVNLYTLKSSKKRKEKKEVIILYETISMPDLIEYD